MSGKSRTDTTSAEDKSIGFDYQYYYFLNELLNLKSGQTVGLEVLDDVHVERPDGTNLLVQLKHTIQTTAQGLPKNLTTMDADLWKSMSNWCKLIADPADGRSKQSDQLTYVRKTSFLLASNKSDNDENAFLATFTAFKTGTKDYSTLVSDIKTIRSATKDATIQGYIDDVLNLDPAVSAKFFEQLSFALGRDQIIEECKASIAAKQIDPSRIDDVFRDVDSEVREKSFETVKARQKITYSFEEFNLKHRRHFDKARSGRLPFRTLQQTMPDNLLDQTFIKQLLDIEDIKVDSIDFHAKFTTRRLNFRNHIDRWLQDGDITLADVEEMEEEAATLWENKFLAVYPGQKASNDEVASGRDIVADLRQRRLRLASEELPVPMSNGGFYDLSDRPIIGWLSNWKDRYN